MPFAATQRSMRAVRNQAKRSPRLNPATIHKFATGTVETIPDIIEFTVSDRYCNRPNLYPRQGTWLKLITMQTEIMTQYDHDVIGEWSETFAKTGNEGLNPGIWDRIRMNKEAGRPWFRETQGVLGRRGSKGYIGGLSTSYVLWNYMNRPEGPQIYYGIDRDKRISIIVFAGKKEQARDNQWRDINSVILGAPCFAPYISRPQNERLTVYAPHDILRIERLLSAGIVSENDQASFEIVPAPSTMMAARGPATCALLFDEQAFVINSTASADAELVYDSSTPSLDQFKQDGFIYAPSSPWQKTGKFYQNWELSIQMEDNLPVYPERLMLQLPSWGLYEDWDEADHIPYRPSTTTVIELAEGRAERPATYKRLRGAVQTYDAQMRQEQRANPEKFAVERLAHWANSLNAYLSEEKVKAIFKPWGDRELVVQRRGRLDYLYAAHGDPSNVNARFGFALGHAETDAEGRKHVVFDLIDHWDPADFDDHTIDYDVPMSQIESYVTDFMPEDISFDQFNVPATIGRLRKFVSQQNFPKRVSVREVKRTAALNWKHSELFKAAINLGLVHAPMYDDQGELNESSDQAELELRFLQEKNGRVDHPTTGPVQTKDIADAVVEVVISLIGDDLASMLGYQLDQVSVSGSGQAGSPAQVHTQPSNDNRTMAEQFSRSMGGTRGGSVGSFGSPARGGMRRR